MKLSIDLNELFDGESLQEAVVRQCREQLVDGLEKKVNSAIDEAVSKKIQDALSKQCDEILPTLISDLIDTEYRPVTSWGSREEPTTIRKQLIKKLEAELMVNRDSWGSSNKSKIQRTIEEMAEEKLKLFKKEFDTSVQKIFVKEAFEYAEKKLKQTFQVPASP